jgi:hypothetical protein
LNENPLKVKAVPDRVPLQPSAADEAPNPRARAADTGTAKLPLGNNLPDASATVNGAVQEDIPARYRVYVQRYFDRNSGKF